MSLADGGAVADGRLARDARRRLFLITEEGEVTGPLALWLSADGLPVAPATWQSVFARANARCERFDVGVWVTPHALRHSYAVHMLCRCGRRSPRWARIRRGPTRARR